MGYYLTMLRLKRSLCVSLFPLRPKISVMFHRFWDKILPFPSPFFLCRDSSLSYPFSHLPIFCPVSESVCLETNWQNCPQFWNTGIAASSAWLHNPDEDPSPAALEGEESLIPILPCCLTATVIYGIVSITHPQYWEDFGFWDFWFFRNLFSKRVTRKGRVSALPRNPWETYLSPVLSWMPDAQCFLPTEFNWVVWGSTPFHPSTPLKKTQSSAGLHFYSRNCFLFVCLCIFPQWIFIWQCNEQFPILSFFSFLSLLFSLNIVKYFCNQKVFLEWIYCHDSVFNGNAQFWLPRADTRCHVKLQVDF